MFFPRVSGDTPQEKATALLAPLPQPTPPQQLQLQYPLASQYVKLIQVTLHRNPKEQLLAHPSLFSRKGHVQGLPAFLYP